MTPSGIVGNGDSGGNFAEPTDGEYDLYELYAEVSIPLLSGEAFAEDLSLDLATRYSEYDEYDETTWKAGGRWTVNPTFSFRAQASTGFRAPNVLELFGGNADSFTGVSDPCNADSQAANPVVRDNCAAQGVPPTFVQPAAQLKITAGGNPDLEPETSDHWSAGVVFTPEWFSNFRLALDWYDIEIDGAISTPAPVDVINACYESPGLSAPECARIDRGGDFSVTRFDLLNENLNSIETSGLDINSTVAFETPIGLINVDWLVTYLDEYVETTDTGIEDDRTGKVACDVCNFSGYPEWKSNMTVQWARDSWNVGLTWRFLDAMDVDDQVAGDDINTETDEIHYFDLFAAYTWDNYQVSAGIENLTDEEPEFVPAISTNTSPIYDHLGQFWYARFKVNF